MPRRNLSALLATALLMSVLSLASSGASAQTNEFPDGVVMAGYGEADATWHVGAGAGQYAAKSPDQTGVLSGGSVDPHGHSASQKDSYGVHSRLSYRAIVVQDAEGDQVAFVKSDNYLAQDFMARRVGQLLDDAGSAVSYDEIFHMASHNHSSPYYTTPSWGVWLFQDAFDLRAFEYHSRAMATAILEAEAALVPAEMGATEVTHEIFKGMIQRAGLADDGTPRGYPRDFGDLGLTVIRFDALATQDSPGGPIATLINWGQHPEGLDDHDLITGDFLAPLERFVERATGAPLVFGQGDVGSAEAGPGAPDKVPAGIPRRWSHAGHAQGERGAFLLAQDVLKGWHQIADGEPIVEFSSDFDVEAGNAFVPGPVSHPYPSVSNCRTHTTAEGNPGAPVAGLPDCARAQDGDDDGNPLDPLFENLKAHGIPVPEHYDAPAFTGVEENLRLKLQAFKLGDVILASCACEAQVDLIKNLETRLDDVEGNLWLGYDWRDTLGCEQNEDGSWTCDHPSGGGEISFPDAAYERMVAQVHNDAAGWNDPEYAPFASSEPADPAEIKGNFTHEELPTELGYKLAVGVGHAGDYNGYTVSYREYMSWDDYRKALTSYGPHTADYMNMWLQDLAESLQPGGTPLPAAINDAQGQADEARQSAASEALGRAAGAAYDAWVASLPDDAGPAEALVQPEDIARFDGATFSWRGGSNAVDNPVVRVQRLVNGEWENFADQSGEVQTKLEFPTGTDALTDTYSGAQEWVWTANFEAFLANPAEIGSTPTGEYRFVADGHIRSGGATTGYHVESDPFQVLRWDGLAVTELSVDSAGDVNFVLPDVYPATYDSVFPYVTTDVMKGQEGGGPDFCAQCSFRPWATTIAYEQVTVTVERADGTVEQIPAQLIGSRWWADASLGAGDQAYIAAGDVSDSFGERNPQGTTSVTI